MAEKLPSKCDSCGLRVFYAHHSAGDTTSVDTIFNNLHVLKTHRIIKHVPARLMGASNVPGDFGSTSFCAVGSRAWQKHDKRCSYWMLAIQEASVADYLALHHGKLSTRLSFWLGVVGLVVGAGGIILGALAAA